VVASSASVSSASVVDLTVAPLVSTSTGGDREPIVIVRLYSPSNAIAELTGTGAASSDPVTVDGELADVLSFVGGESDTEFRLQVWIEDEGAHTVCVAATCGRVYTLAPDAETPAQITERINQAIPLALEYLDYPTIFPEWKLVIGGAMSGTGGTTDLQRKTVTIHRNRGRTVDDYVRTILHEFGHVADAELLDDTDRAQYLVLRGIDPATVWRDSGATRLEQWGHQPSEDFAEVMVMIWSSRRWTPRTTELAPTPDDSVLTEVAGLLAE
jgi:hypothetical protein